MERALGAQWEALAPALKAHYRCDDNVDSGQLSIEFPSWMGPYLRLIHRLGALLHRRGSALPTTVEKRQRGDVQHWARTIRYPDGSALRFDSVWHHAGGAELTEYVNRFLGLHMRVWVADGRLHYAGRHIVVRVGRLCLRVPEWLVLGHTTIVETALDDQRFAMDFRLTHPLLGQIYRYAGVFSAGRPLPPAAQQTVEAVRGQPDLDGSRKQMHDEAKTGG